MAITNSLIRFVGSALVGSALLSACVESSSPTLVQDPFVQDPFVQDPADSISTITERIDPVITYRIPARGHYAFPSPWQQFEGSSLEFTATFNQSAVYVTQDPNNQADINKLAGFSDCSSFHQQNSARFGWRWFNDELQILAYTYIQGQRQSQLINSVPLNQPSVYRVERMEGSYQFTLNENMITMLRGCAAPEGFSYRLYPYFGGDERAPQRITIQVSYH